MSSTGSGGIVYPRCPMPYRGLHCELTFAQVLGENIYSQLFGWYLFLTLLLSSLTFIQTIRLVKLKGLRPLTLQHYLFTLVVFGSFTFLIRCVDPGSLQDFLPLLLLFWMTDLCTAAVYAIIFLVVMSWVKLIHVIRPPSPNRIIHMRHIILLERVFIIFLFFYTFICSTVTYAVHPSYIGDALKTLNFILFNIIMVIIGWLQALPIYHTLMKPVPNLSAEITARKKAQVAVVIKLMCVLSLLSCGAIEIQWWSVHTNLDRPWDWKYRPWGPPHQNLGGIIEAFQFDCIQWICLMSTLFFFRRFTNAPGSAVPSTPSVRPAQSSAIPPAIVSQKSQTELTPQLSTPESSSTGRAHERADGQVSQGHKWLSFKDEPGVP
jgi:hypothetical protein